MVGQEAHNLRQGAYRRSRLVCSLHSTAADRRLLGEQVAGTTIYNCIKMGELECIESTDRPAEPPRILRCDVVWNPFEDIVPRNLRPQGADVVLVDNAAELGGAKKRKNLALLSFGDDEVVEEEDAQAPPPKRAGKSIHDVVEDDARLVKAGTADEEQVKAQLDAEWEREQAARAVRSKLAGPSVEGEPDDGGDFEARMKRKIQEKRKELLDAAGLPPPPPPPPLPPPPAAAPRDVVDKEARRREKEEATKRAEAEKLHRLGLTKLAAESGLYSAGETKRREIKYRKDAIAERERETLAKLSRFQESLHSKPHAEPVAPESAAGADGDADEREGGIGLTRFRSEGLYYDDDDDDKDWRGHALHFKPTGGSAKSFAPSTDDYVVLDPLLEKGKAAFLKSKEAKRKTEWAGRSRT